jgi:uncharacterized damage-inducible protein DinB
MELIEHQRRQFAYNVWANREVVSAIRASSAVTKRSLQLVAHISAAESLWLERIKRIPQSLPVWPEFDLENCDAITTEVGGLWTAYMARISAADLAEAVFYKNTRGEPWESTVQDIATHVLTHSAYHRGQIASHMRENGQTPAYTDFIHAVRQGLIE